MYCITISKKIIVKHFSLALGILCLFCIGIKSQLLGQSTVGSNTPLPATQLAAPKSGLRYSYYEGVWDKVTAHATAKVLSQGIASGINLNKAKEEINYALDFEGYLLVPQTGLYEITLNCDDGGILKIDDSAEINHDGIHMAYEKSVSVLLEKGFHRLQLSYFQGEGTSALELYWKVGNGKKVLIPKTAYFHDAEIK